jgi:flagellar biosynthesis protein FlhF
MLTKTYRAPNMLAALESVQRELGPEALIVSVKQIPGGAAWEVWRKPAIEVVAMQANGATETAPVAAPKAASANTSTSAANSKAIAPAVWQAFARSQAANSHAAPPAAIEPRGSVGAEPAPARLPTDTADFAALASSWSGALAAFHRRLKAQGVAEDVLRQKLDACMEALPLPYLEDEARVRKYLAHQLEAGLTYPAPAAITTTGVLCLVGMSGAGKTTTAAKLAAYYTRTLNLRVAWVCADTYRAGAIAQARGYAESLRLPLRVAYTADELQRCVSLESQADLVIVDLPGCNPWREAQVLEIGTLLTALDRRLTYLVAPATAKDADLSAALAAFSLFELKGLVLTKLDETATLGSVFNLAWNSRLPLLYFSAGPRALEDFEPAQAAKLVRALLDGEWPQSVARTA